MTFLQKKSTIRCITLLALFFFVFLGLEYFFDNQMAYVTDADGVVRAQSIILGISAIGFLGFPLVHRFITERKIGYLAAVALSVCGVVTMCLHISAGWVMLGGEILFFVLGMVGNHVHYLAARILEDQSYLARSVGMAYACGILLQFINHNLVTSEGMEAIPLTVFMLVLLYLLWDTEEQKNIGIISTEEVTRLPKDAGEQKLAVCAGILLIVIIGLMTCVFSTLDNAVTLVHAQGNVDIGQWPRLLLGLSGLAAGFLYDWKHHKYMNIIMYCVMLLSTICIIILEWGGPFLLGLFVFYLSAGFFSVYFTAGCMEMSFYQKVPELWAGMGRGINNACALITTAVSAALLKAANQMSILILSLVLFVFTSIMMYFYIMQRQELEHRIALRTTGRVEISREARFRQFAEAFALTNREQEVLKVLLVSDGSVQDLASQLAISRAALYRHIGNLNEKTNTKTRIGLLQFYYEWNGGTGENEK